MPKPILWRRLDEPGHDHCQLRARPDGWRLDGVALFHEDGIPYRLDYEADCDRQWRTVAARVRGVAGDRLVDLEIRVDAHGGWWSNGVQCPAVQGAIDVDFGFSPCTNLLPIRRLALPLGGSAPVRTAWLASPSLELAPLEQTYRRTAATSYVFDAPALDFTAVLEVDAQGMVTRYGDLWVSERSFA